MQADEIESAWTQTLVKIMKRRISEMEKRQLILAVDDEEPILKLLRANLSKEGYDVATAADGNSALALLEKQRPDLVLLDIMMPGLDGFQVLQSMRQRFDFPIIMLTGKREASMVRDAIDLGADDYVRKPFSIGELKARIKAKLRRAETAVMRR